MRLPRRTLPAMATQVVAGGSLRVPMTYAAYRALGGTKHHEYYDGMCVINPPSRRHAVVARRLTRVLEDACPTGYDVIPEWGWRVQTQQEFGPDVMVVADTAPGADLLRAAPLLVVEVTSPSTRSEDWGRKLTAYAEGGAQWYWIVDPDAGEVAVFRNVAGEFAPRVRLADGCHRLAEPLPHHAGSRDPFSLSSRVASASASASASGSASGSASELQVVAVPARHPLRVTHLRRRDVVQGGADLRRQLERLARQRVGQLRRCPRPDDRRYDTGPVAYPGQRNRDRRGAQSVRRGQHRVDHPDRPGRQVRRDKAGQHLRPRPGVGRRTAAVLPGQHAPPQRRPRQDAQPGVHCRRHHLALDPAGQQRVLHLRRHQRRHRPTTDGGGLERRRLGRLPAVVVGDADVAHPAAGDRGVQRGQ